MSELATSRVALLLVLNPRLVVLILLVEVVGPMDVNSLIIKFDVINVCVVVGAGTPVYKLIAFIRGLSAYRAQSI